MAGASLYRLPECNLDVAKFVSFQFNGGNTPLYRHIILTARGVLPFVDYDLFKW